MAVVQMKIIIFQVLFYLGSFICILNFYLSFLRYPIYKLIHSDSKEYKWTSGVPIVGSFFEVISLIFLYKTKWMLISGIIFIILDTGGLHWFLGTVFYHAVLKKKKMSD